MYKLSGKAKKNVLSLKREKYCKYYNLHIFTKNRLKINLERNLIMYSNTYAYFCRFYELYAHLVQVDYTCDSLCIARNYAIKPTKTRGKNFAKSHE